MALPSDPYMLLSVINMKLRDGALSMDDICADEGVDVQEIAQKLAKIGYFYDENRRAFVSA